MVNPDGRQPLLMTRRSILGGLSGCLATGIASALPAHAANPSSPPTDRRPLPANRRFVSPAIEGAIAEMSRRIADPTLASMFERCFPNTLDTTVFPGAFDGRPDTFVITGDIDAMWLRDSSAQVWPYLRFARQDPRLASLLQGVVRRQARMVLIDPYANAFQRTAADPPLPWAVHDKTEMKPGVGERKWEIDSLCYVVRLAWGYWKATGDTSPFDSQWRAAAWNIVRAFQQQQRLTSRGPYSFERLTLVPTDTLPLQGYGNPARSVGMIYSMFRPSDDACIYPLFVPANLFAVQALQRLEEMASKVLSDPKLASACGDLLRVLVPAVHQHGIVQHPQYGAIWAYEVDGYGNALLMDDANIPSLLGLPYLGLCDVRDPLYQRTRAFVLSPANPYFFHGSAGEGIGGPHIGLGFIWPISIIVRALTSTDDHEILACLRTLRATTAGTGFMHESFCNNNPSQFTRAWFAWANTLFGEMLLTLADTRPQLLRATF